MIRFWIDVAFAAVFFALAIANRLRDVREREEYFQWFWFGGRQ